MPQAGTGNHEGTHLRASFHKVLSFKSSRQDAGAKGCCMQIILHPPGVGDPSHPFISHLSFHPNLYKLHPPIQKGISCFLQLPSCTADCSIYARPSEIWLLGIFFFFLTKSASFKGRPGLTLISETCFKCLF